MKRAPIALLFALAALAILPLPANAIPIHKHFTIHKVVGHDADGPITVPRQKVLVVNVPPSDRDDDGCPDSQDSYNGPGCSAPAPKPAPSVSDSIAATTPAPTSVPTGSGGYTIPDYIVQCESGGSYTAQNPSGAYGAYQIMPATASAYGCDLSTASGQDSCAAAIYADVGPSAWSCG